MAFTSLHLEGLAVGALVHGGVRLVAAHQDALQAAIVGAVAVVAAVGDGAFDGMVGVVAVAAHRKAPPVIGMVFLEPVQDLRLVRQGVNRLLGRKSGQGKE